MTDRFSLPIRSAQPGVEATTELVAWGTRHVMLFEVSEPGEPVKIAWCRVNPDGDGWDLVTWRNRAGEVCKPPAEGMTGKNQPRFLHGFDIAVGIGE